MLYRFGVTIPANTPQTSPKATYLRLGVGVIKRVLITFPAGCAGLVGVRVLHRGSVILPSSPDEWLSGDDLTLDIPMEYELGPGEDEVLVVAYNVDEVYDHTPVVRFHVEEVQEDLQLAILANGFQAMADVMEDLVQGMARIERELARMAEELRAIRSSDIPQLVNTVAMLWKVGERGSEGVL